MAEIRWTEQSSEDLDAIVRYIARDSPHYASLFCIKVLTKIEMLEKFPMLGRIVPETDDRLFANSCLGIIASSTG